MSLSIKDDRPTLAERLRRISERCAALPERDPRPADEILGYDDRGLFG